MDRAEAVRELDHLAEYLGAAGIGRMESLAAVASPSASSSWSKDDKDDEDDGDDEDYEEQPGVGRFINEMGTDIAASMELAAKIYVMSDKLLSPGLKVLSLKFFNMAAQCALTKNKATPEYVGSLDCIPGLVEFVYGNTTATDLALKECICWLVCIARSNAIFWRSMQPVMLARVDFTISLTNYLAQDPPLKDYDCPTCGLPGCYKSVMGKSNFESTIFCANYRVDPFLSQKKYTSWMTGKPFRATDPGLAWMRMQREYSLMREQSKPSYVRPAKRKREDEDQDVVGK